MLPTDVVNIERSLIDDTTTRTQSVVNDRVIVCFTDARTVFERVLSWFVSWASDSALSVSSTGAKFWVESEGRLPGWRRALVLACDVVYLEIGYAVVSQPMI